VKFLVRIDVQLPPTLPEAERTELLAAELERGRELVAAGAIRAIWRLPGGLRNVGVWEAADATELHNEITSLPLFPWLTAEVTALADHPLQAFLND
jgi:muconolactone D-isomerase